jgi:hypothetical protein
MTGEGEGFFFFFLVSRELMLYFFVGEISWLEYGELQNMPSKMTAMPVERRDNEHSKSIHGPIMKYNRRNRFSNYPSSKKHLAPQP